MKRNKGTPTLNAFKWTVSVSTVNLNAINIEVALLLCIATGIAFAPFIGVEQRPGGREKRCSTSAKISEWLQIM